MRSRLRAVKDRRSTGSGHALPDESRKLRATAPETYKVKFVTTKGDVIVQVNRAWSPKGADRFYNLVKAGFFTDMSFFRIVPNFIVQFGISPQPAVAKVWEGLESRTIR